MPETELATPTQSPSAAAPAGRDRAFLILIVRAADALKRHYAAAVEHEGLTIQQFNVLDILERARPDGLPTLTVRDRMVERAPAITRLVDRLVARGLVERRRDPGDRRVVFCSITAEGSAALERLQGPLLTARAAALAAVNPDEQAEVTEILERMLATIDPDGSDPT